MKRTRLAAACTAAILIVCAAVSLGGGRPSASSVVPLFAIVHPNQLVPPSAGGAERAYVLIFLDETSRILTYSGTDTRSSTSLELHGPAVPGKSGPVRFTTPGAQVPVEVGPLSEEDVWLLMRGYMYLEFVDSEGPRSRGQILPIKGVVYPTP